MRAALAANTSIGFQSHDVWQWLFVAGALLLAIGFAPVLWLRGSPGGRGGLTGLLLRLASGLERLMNIPAWSAAGFTIGVWSLTVAYIGFVWDVAWHADNGRDFELFTVPHTLIIMGLGGIAAAAVAMVLLATLTKAPVGWRVGRLHVPYSAWPMALLGLGALIGFPLDDVWHATFGIDITMWSPTHLLMIGAASLMPIVLWLMLGEAIPDRSEARRVFAHTAGLVLIGLSTFQLEFDLGIPQWQLFYHPMLIAASAGIVLVAARAAAGPGGALVAGLYYLVIRGGIALLVGPGFGHSVPHFALYIPEVAVVELVFLFRRRMGSLGTALAAGLGIGTIGAAAEFVWIRITFTHPWGSSLLPYSWIVMLVAICGSILGMALGRTLLRQPTGLPRFAASAALVVLALPFLVHLPARHAEPAQLTVQTQQVGAAHMVLDRYGAPSLTRRVNVNVATSPASLVDGADWFDVVAWQGGTPVEHADLQQTSPGHFGSTFAVPVGGNWKTLVYLAKGDTLEAVPVAMPADPLYGLPGVDAPKSRTMAAVPASTLLMRETHGGAQWVAYLVFIVFGLAVVTWVVSISLAYRELAATRPGAGAVPPRLTRPGLRRPALS